MTKLRTFLVLAFLTLLTGCTDTMESITRELRNCNNEAIDAMMMVTSEEQAYRMTIRVLKPLNERYSAIDYKFKAWESNRASNREIVEETFNSNGFYLYLAELEVNKMRFSMEKTRMRNLYRQYQERKLEEMRAAGDENPVIRNPSEVCPNLHKMIMTEQVLMPIETQLKGEKIKQLVGRFPTMKGVDKEYPELYKLFLKKSEIIKPEIPNIVF